MSEPVPQPVENTTPPKRTNRKEEGKKKKKEALIDLEPVKGTRDFPPEEMRKQAWLFNHFHEVARLFSFEAYDAPILESEELYIRKAGEEITQQMYNFKDKGDRPVSLRPEMTPSLARMVLAKGRALQLPIRWYAIPQCWRYEATTRGRRREHYQWNMDIMGVKEVTAEAELLAAIVTFFQRVGLTANDIYIKVSSRQLIQSVLEQHGVGEDKFSQTCIIVDKLDKLPREQVAEELKAIGIDSDTANTIIDTLSLGDLDEFKRTIGESHPAVKTISQLFTLAEGYGIAEWLKFDPSVVRGLAYYTGIVFEAFEKPREGAIGRAVCGGGRYDRLLTTFDPRVSVPACGFGFGDCVIMEVLNDRGLLPPLEKNVDYVVIPFNESLRVPAVRVTAKLRAKGHSADIIMPEKKRVDWCFSHADRVGAAKAVIVAPSEWAEGKVKIKDLRAAQGSEEKEIVVSFDEL